MNQTQTIAAGDIVSGLEPNELVEVRRVAPFGAKTLVEGITLQRKQEIKRPLSAQELAQLVKVRSQAHSFDGDPQVFLLGAEAERICIAHQFDPLFAVNSTVVHSLPHYFAALCRSFLAVLRVPFFPTAGT